MKQYFKLYFMFIYFHNNYSSYGQLARSTLAWPEGTRVIVLINSLPLVHSFAASVRVIVAVPEIFPSDSYVIVAAELVNVPPSMASKFLITVPASLTFQPAVRHG